MGVRFYHPQLYILPRLTIWAEKSRFKSSKNREGREMQGIRVKIADILDFILNLEKPTEPYLSAAHGYVSHPA